MLNKLAGLLLAAVLFWNSPTGAAAPSISEALQPYVLSHTCQGEWADMPFALDGYDAALVDTYVVMNVRAPNGTRTTAATFASYYDERLSKVIWPNLGKWPCLDWCPATWQIEEAYIAAHWGGQAGELHIPIANVWRTSSHRIPTACNHAYLPYVEGGRK